MVGPEKLPMGSTSSLPPAQPDPGSDGEVEIIIMVEKALVVMEIKARFTTLTMIVARMIKLQSDAKRRMYTCLECDPAKSRGKTGTR